MPEKSILDARLAEIDRRLRTIQSGLEPAAHAAREAPAAVVPPETAREAPAAVVPPEAAPVPKRLGADARALEDVVARLAALVEAHERLLACARELADRGQAADPGATVSISAGPFASTEALHRFERSLQTLPEVRAVAVREYEGADRAIVDVHLSEPTP